MTEILQDTTTAALTDAIDANLIEKSLSFARFTGCPAFQLVTSVSQVGFKLILFLDG